MVVTGIYQVSTKYLPNIYRVSNYLQLVLLTTPHPGDVRWQSAFLLSTMLVPPLGRVFNYYEICADRRVGTGHRALGGLSSPRPRAHASTSGALVLVTSGSSDINKLG